MRRFFPAILVLLAACGTRVETASPGTPATGAPAPDGTRVSGPYVHKNLTVYLIHSDKRDDGDFVTLDEALKNKWVEVTEKQNAQVNELLLENKGDRPLFIQEGDRVIGGKQDRIIGKSFVVPPRSGAKPVPSFCVEQGRWHGAGAHFQAGANMALASKGVREAAKYGNNQGGVWQEVAKAKDGAARQLGTSNSNTSLNEALEDKNIRKLCDEAAAAFKDLLGKHPDAVGMAVAVNGRIEEINVYPGHPLLAKLFPRLVQSYALEAATNATAAPATPPTAEEVVRFMVEPKETSRRAEEISPACKAILMDCTDQIRAETTFDGKSVHKQWMKKGDASREADTDPRRNQEQRPQTHQQR